MTNIPCWLLNTKLLSNTHNWAQLPGLVHRRHGHALGLVANATSSSVCQHACCTLLAMDPSIYPSTHPLNKYLLLFYHASVIALDAIGKFKDE